MWRTILAVILLPSLTAAQVEIPTTPQTTETSGSQTVPVGASHPDAKYNSYTRLNEVRRGITEDIAIQLVTKAYLAWPAHSAAGALPVKLEIEPTEGFTFKNFRFPKPYVQKFGSEQQYPVRVVDGWDPIQFSLRVGDNVALGQHVLNGRLAFEEVLDNGTTIARQVDIQIPVTVVDNGVKLRKNDQYPWVGYSKGMIVLFILLAPVLVLYFIGCGLTLGSPGICQM